MTFDAKTWTGPYPAHVRAAYAEGVALQGYVRYWRPVAEGWLFRPGVYAADNPHFKAWSAALGRAGKDAEVCPPCVLPEHCYCEGRR